MCTYVYICMYTHNMIYIRYAYNITSYVCVYIYIHIYTYIYIHLSLSLYIYILVGGFIGCMHVL